ncbi:MAG: hypothetical protein ACKVQA_22750 [Burkholderiales bacterium]
MKKHLVLLIISLCFASRGEAVEWDRDANLAGAVAAFIEAYNSGGLEQAEQVAQACQQSLTAIQDTLQRLMRFEFCSGLEFAGFLTNRRDMDEKGAPSSEYFAATQIGPRLDRLGEFIADPVAQTTVIRGWGRSVAGELDRRLR